MPNSSQSEDLIAISKQKGWDPTKIWNQETGKYEDSIADWDHPREPFSRGLGDVPGGAPAVNSGGASIGARDPRVPGGSGDPSEPSVLEERVTWNTPGKSDQRANLKPDRGIKQGMEFINRTTWNTGKDGDRANG